MQPMNYFFRTTCKGFTLLEVLVSLAIFTVMMVAVSQTFAGAFSGYRNTRALQRDLENAQYFMNILAKELRTSSVVSPLTGPFPVSSQFVQFYDHSQGKCFHYKIEQNALRMDEADAAGVAACGTMTLSAFETVSTGIVAGAFYVTPSTVAPDTPMRVGKVTISLDVSEGNVHHAYVQTTVSLRDFGNIGL